MSTLSEAEKRRIAGRARTLQERLEPDRAVDGAGGDFVEPLDVSVDEYVDEWRENVADGDREAFRRRLRHDDLDLAACRRRITASEWPADRPLPDWIARLEAILDHVDENPSAEFDYPSDDEIPFVEIVSPFVDYALAEADAVRSAPLARSAVDGLLEWLAGQLAHFCSHSLFIEFKTYVADRDPDLVFSEDVQPEEGSRQYYEAFVDAMLDGGLAPFFLEYSYLARLVVTTVRQWIARAGEFCNRVAADRAELRETFGDGDLGSVTAVEALGDPHHGGRTVLGVTFESGTKVSYKPRNSGVVVGFYETVEWVNANGDLPELRTLDFLERDDYAWMEWIRPEECPTRDAVVEYYRRAGMLVCLFYAFDATDIHFENIVAHGDQPVAVDLETLAQPMVAREMRSIEDTVEVIADTVLRTGAVPEYTDVQDVENLSGFSAQHVEFDLDVQDFTNVNTDRMELETVRHPPREGENLPRHDGEIVGPEEHADAIVRGFTETYRFIVDHERELLADDGPIERLTERKARVRALYRDSMIYSHLRGCLTASSYHRSGLQFGLEVEQLAKLVVTDEVDPEVWSVYRAERRVLRRGNLPRFTADVTSTDLYGDGTVVEDFFEKEPISHVRERIRGFDEAGLGEQRDYISWGYGGHEAVHSGTPTGTDASEYRDLPDFERAAEDAAREVFDRIVDSSLDGEADPTWILREVEPDRGMHVHSIGDCLYDGRVGIGVFAAGLARASGDGRYGEFARRAVSPTIAEIDEGSFAFDRSIGGAVGLGSIVYGFTKMGALLDDERYLRAASEVAAGIGPERVRADEQYDVLHGSAGLILGSLALYEETGRRDALDLAVRAGEHLLENRSEHDGVRTVRPAGVERPLCGFAHGVAGIAYALFGLGDATGEARFESAAVESIEYERRKYDEEAGNWPDLRANTDREWMDAWCHGRSGIGLARLGMYERADRPELRRDVERALGGVDPSTMFSRDHLCCGNFGRVELLLRAGRSLSEPTYRRDAERLAAATVRRADAEGQFRTQWQTERWHNPSFFAGEAGIGYSLLRFVDPSLPCVLLWE